MKNYGCKRVELGINPLISLIVVRGPHLVMFMTSWIMAGPSTTPNLPPPKKWEFNWGLSKGNRLKPLFLGGLHWGGGSKKRKCKGGKRIPSEDGCPCREPAEGRGWSKGKGQWQEGGSKPRSWQRRRGCPEEKLSRQVGQPQWQPEVAKLGAIGQSRMNKLLSRQKIGRLYHPEWASHPDCSPCSPHGPNGSTSCKLWWWFMTSWSRERLL